MVNYRMVAHGILRAFHDHLFVLEAFFQIAYCCTCFCSYPSTVPVHCFSAMKSVHIGPSKMSQLAAQWRFSLTLTSVVSDDQAF
jgi:aromatic ring-opening dioxygenase LigB subunit